MKGRVTFPFRVKYNGKYYAPGDVVKVDDIDDAISNGAEVFGSDEKDSESKKDAEKHVKRQKKET